MSRVITPTVGRKVWYRPSKSDQTGPVPMQTASDPTDTTNRQPLDATVISVWGDRMINVLVTDIMGRQFPVLSCTLLQPGEEPAVDLDGKPVGRYCEWMPYQVATAVPACQGDRCGATDGVSHSAECVAEASVIQGWSQSSSPA
jgi:hypothetical protein